ncbi:MAG: hypothetical protein HY397_00630 [Candidatus Doudnabacteria bacterium]|nr:hypothetical protein [Candidatus Doudnabacteria bacterium]
MLLFAARVPRGSELHRKSLTPQRLRDPGLVELGHIIIQPNKNPEFPANPVLELYLAYESPAAVVGNQVRRSIEKKGAKFGFAGASTQTRAEPEIESAKAQTKEIIVANPTADAQIFEAYADDFARAFLIVPESFTLEAGGRKAVAVTLVPNRPDGGRLNTKISILAKTVAANKLQVNAGVKIPITIIAPTTSNSWLRVLGIILTLGGLGVIFFALFRKNKHPSNLKIS